MKALESEIRYLQRHLAVAARNRRWLRNLISRLRYWRGAAIEATQRELLAREAQALAEAAAANVRRECLELLERADEYDEPFAHCMSERDFEVAQKAVLATVDIARQQWA